MVWAVTWDGCGLVRTGVSRDNPFGKLFISFEKHDEYTWNSLDLFFFSSYLGQPRVLTVLDGFHFWWLWVDVGR